VRITIFFETGNYIGRFIMDIELKKQLITVSEAAALLSVAPITLRKWGAQGRLPLVKLGRAVRVRLEDIQRIAQEGIVQVDERK